MVFERKPVHVAVLAVLLCGVPACGGESGQTIVNPGDLSVWIAAGTKRFDGPATSEDFAKSELWHLTIQQNRQMRSSGSVAFHQLDDESTRWLKEHDTADLRASYAKTLILAEAMIERMKQPNSGISYPVEVATLQIFHCDDAGHDIIDEAQALPVGGVVLMSEIDANPELSAFFGKLSGISASLK